MAGVAVLGAGGPTGFECVKQALALTTGSVRAVVRDPVKYKFPEDSRLSVVPGDVSDPPSLTAALQGCKSVIFAASGKGFWSAHAVDNQGVVNTAAAAKAAGIDHVVLITSQLVTPKNRWNPVRILLNNIRWGLMDSKFAGENALRGSGVPYTIVRPAGLSKAQGGVTRVVAGQGDKGISSGSSISRADVAAVCVAALLDPSASRGVTLEISGTKDQVTPEQFKENILGIFKGLKTDLQL